MPHLSPMSWLAGLLLFWTACMLLTASMWWQSDNHFSASGVRPSTLGLHPWTWQ